MINPLFALIKDGIIKLPKRTVFTEKTNLQDNAYFLVELPAWAQSILDQDHRVFHLTEHHVSFYAKQLDRSQYHYTASLQTEDQEFILHVYFNERDQLVDKLRFQMSDESGKSDITLDPVFEQALIELAIEQSRHMVGHIRRQQNAHILQLERRYSVAAKALEKYSFHLHRYQEVYRDSLDEALVALHGLGRYHGGQKYRSIAGLLERSSAYMLDQARLKQERLAKAAVAKKVIKAPKPATTILLESKKVAKPAAEIIDVIDEPLPLEKDLAQLTQSWAAYFDYKGDDFTQSLSLFNEFGSVLLNAGMTSMDQSHRATVDEMACIQHHSVLQNSHGVRLLTRCLLSNDYKNATTLKSFAGMLNPSLVSIALRSGNGQLLDFLLTHMDIAINTLEVEDNITPVLYCYLNHSEKSPKTDCLEVLIRHGASLMSRHEGLPVAFYLLSQVKNTLKQALIRTSNLTITNPRFYKLLIRECESYVKGYNKGSVSPDFVLAVIANLSAEVKTLQQLSASFPSSAVVEADQHISAIVDVLGHDCVERLQQDPDILRAREAYFEIVNDYLKTLPAAQRRSVVAQGKKFLGDVSQMLKLVNLAGVDLKQNLLEFYHDTATIILKRIELDKLQTRLKQPIYSQRKASKLNSQVQRLADEINKLSRGFNAAQKVMLEMNGLDEDEICDIVNVENLLVKLQDALKDIVELIGQIQPADNDILGLKSLFALDGLLKSDDEGFDHDSDESVNSSDVQQGEQHSMLKK